MPALAALSSQAEGGSGRAVVDRFRCPPSLVNFELTGLLNSKPGFFRFGENVLCYGRTAHGNPAPRVEDARYDAMADTQTASGAVALPFNPSEVIENFYLERYRPDEWRAAQRLQRDLYYALRPVTTPKLRQRLQRFHIRDWQRLPFPRWPVDTSVESLCDALLSMSLTAKGLENAPFIWFWPRGARGCVLITHDVETEAGRDFCPRLLDLDEEYGIRAAYQIIPEERYSVPADFLNMIRERGCEITVHDLNHDGRLFHDHDEFQRRLDRIHHYADVFGAKGFRAGVLYRRPEWFDALRVSYDMSIPNVGHLDAQRGGCCTVMPYFIGDLLEIPVTMSQDYALFHLLREHSIALWKRQLEIVLEHCGLASFIVHPDYLQLPGAQPLYEDLLRHLGELREREQLWFALPGEVDAWWRLRNRLSVVRTGDSWRIEGEGAEQATLAFVRNDGGELVYDLPGSAAAV